MFADVDYVSLFSSSRRASCLLGLDSFRLIIALTGCGMIGLIVVRASLFTGSEVLDGFLTMTRCCTVTNLSSTP